MRVAPSLIETLDAIRIKALFESLRPDPSWSFANCSPRETGRLTHGYHRYPAKFIPQLVDRLMDEYAGDVARPSINDLFMGSGTTIACAIERGYRATGTDINEVAFLISRAKATPIDPSRIERRREWLYGRLQPLDAGYTSNTIPCLTPECERIENWFPERHRIELGQILAALLEIDNRDERRFFLCAFSHVLKNCSIWDMGSTKPTRDWGKEPRRPWPTFLIHLQKMAERNRQFWMRVSPEIREDLPAFLDIRCQDARRQPCRENSVDLQITSPPYVTSYEYADLHQLTTMWLAPTEELRSFRQKFIGTSRPSNHRPIHGNSHIVSDILEQIADADPLLMPGIQRYFSDMRECFDESYRILKPGGHACYVIGNTRLKGVPITNGEAFVELMVEAGFQLERVIMREIPLKTLPQIRDPQSGRFSRPDAGSLVHAYPTEYIIIVRKPA